jgi:hypothetical protein
MAGRCANAKSVGYFPDNAFGHAILRTALISARFRCGRFGQRNSPKVNDPHFDTAATYFNLMHVILPKKVGHRAAQFIKRSD